MNRTECIELTHNVYSVILKSIKRSRERFFFLIHLREPLEYPFHVQPPLEPEHPTRVLLGELPPPVELRTVTHCQQHIPAPSRAARADAPSRLGKGGTMVSSTLYTPQISSLLAHSRNVRGW